MPHTRTVTCPRGKDWVWFCVWETHKSDWSLQPDMAAVSWVLGVTCIEVTAIRSSLRWTQPLPPVLSSSSINLPYCQFSHPSIPDTPSALPLILPPFPWLNGLRSQRLFIRPLVYYPPSGGGLIQCAACHLCKAPSMVIVQHVPIQNKYLSSRNKVIRGDGSTKQIHLDRTDMIDLNHFFP